MDNKSLNLNRLKRPLRTRSTAAAASKKTTKIAKIDLFSNGAINKEVHALSVVIPPVETSLETAVTTKAAASTSKTAATTKAAASTKSKTASTASKAASSKTASTTSKTASTASKAASTTSKAASKTAAASSPKSVTVHNKSKEVVSNKLTTLNTVINEVDSSRELAKLIQISQKNASNLNLVLKNQEKIENILNEQQGQISTIISRLDSQEKIDVGMKRKGKDTKKKSDEFYQSTVKKLAHELFQEHKRLNIQEIKERLETKLNEDEYCAAQLQQLQNNGISYDDLWEEKLYSLMLNANRTKKGYYIRRLKESLWSVFGINRIKPFDDSYSKEQMLKWKQSESVKKVHEDLYTPSDPNDPSSDTYIALIIKSVFSLERERTPANSLWTQSVLETIFDEAYKSPKIENDAIDSWLDTLTDTDVNSEKCMSGPPSPKSPVDDDVDDDNNNDHGIDMLEIDQY